MNVEVIITPLPEREASNLFQLARCLLFQHLQGDRKGRNQRLSNEQMNILGHENISRNDESVASANRLKLALEGLVSRALAKQRQPSITAESYEMKVPGFLITNKALGHGIGILHRRPPVGGLCLPTLALEKSARMGHPLLWLVQEWVTRRTRPLAMA